MPKRRRRILVPIIRRQCTVMAVVFLLIWAWSGWQGAQVHGEMSIENELMCGLETLHAKSMSISNGCLEVLYIDAKVERWDLSWYTPLKRQRYMNRWTFAQIQPRQGFQLPGLNFYAVFPIWILSLLFAIPAAALWTTHIRATRRSRVGACPRCGYDLRGLHGPNPTCPECGPTPVDSKP